MKAKKVLAIGIACVALLFTLIIPVSASEPVNNGDSVIVSEDAVTRQVSQKWDSLSLDDSYKTLPTNNAGDIDNWYGSYATVTFRNKGSSDYIYINIFDYDSNGNRNHAYYDLKLYGNGDSITKKVTPGGYYRVQAKSGNVSTGINLSTYTDR